MTIADEIRNEVIFRVVQNLIKMKCSLIFIAKATNCTSNEIEEIIKKSQTENV